MEVYLLKSTICLTLLFVFYKIVLENSSMHHFKRFYLLGSLAAAFLIPLITFTTYVEASPLVPIYASATERIILTETVQPLTYWPTVLWIIYAIGVVFFSVKFFRNIQLIVQKIHRNPKCQKSGITHVLLNETIIPHTFFNYIFLNKSEFEKNEIPLEVMLHEEAHAHQKHSFDIVLIEILKILFWFNPLLFFFKRSIKLNHEFLADEAVLSHGFEMAGYQKLLLTFSTKPGTPILAHSINYASIKKRFSIMKTNTSRRAILFRSILILPLLAFLIYGFSTTETVEKYNGSSFVSVNDTIEDIQIKIDENSKIFLNGKTVSLSNLKDELNKLNTSLSVEQKRKYLSASIDVENESHSDLAEEVGNILYSSNIRSWSITSLKGERDAGLKHIPQTNPMAGKTVAEAEVMHQAYLKEVEKFEKATPHATNDKNNPWSVQVGTSVEIDETTGEIIQQKATKAEIKKYNKLAKKYNAIAIEKRNITKKDLELLKRIYSKMTDEQKAKAEPFPKFDSSSASNKTGFNFNQDINTNIPTPETPSFYTDNKEVKANASTVFMYEDMVIPAKKAIELLYHSENKIYTSASKENGQDVVRISASAMKNGKKFALFNPSPSIITMSDKSLDPNTGITDATYYYQNMVITPEKANELLKNNSKLRVFINKTEDGKGTITLSEKVISNIKIDQDKDNGY
ncbi:M56 family metallopeptidase [Aequorivita marina]|uniref:M56 family metallopeptidase n=1 Tax=Aequorivita marina TaxID=3073654 RepID=UPI002874CE75|nr:M56 family metallopeptidase [Aequorivita sp. S2608]MDS1297104.1 M56 family metallopeptidase [Aequorivita sp. S2608]